MDFKELPVNGQAFEQLMRELLFSLGLHVEWSGRGPDGGRDLLCRETLEGVFAPQTRTWLVQCKHNAHAGSSVSVGDLDEIITSCSQHDATGYLLACTTQPSSGVVDRLEAISANARSLITAVYWDAVTIERLLSQPRLWAIAQQFMPNSCGVWQLYATEAPNDFVAHYSGYVFHLTNRIGSRVGHHLPSIAARISEIETLALPDGHFVRPRAVWFDDKGGGYKWYVDYMRPDKEPPAINKAKLLVALRDSWVLEDGQPYSWDIQYVRYAPWSDHYDVDHYGYYTKFLPNFVGGGARERASDDETYWTTRQEIEELEKTSHAELQASFDLMVGAFQQIPYLRVVRAVNCNPEILSKMERRFDWSDLTRSLDADMDNVFTASLILEVLDQKKFFVLLEKIPNCVERHFRASRVYVFLPGRGLDAQKGDVIFDLKFRIHPILITNQKAARKEANSYFMEIQSVVAEELVQSAHD